LKNIAIIMLILLLITACSSGKNERPQDIRAEVWNEGQQIAVKIKHKVEQDTKDDSYELALNRHIRTV